MNFSGMWPPSPGHLQEKKMGWTKKLRKKKESLSRTSRMVSEAERQRLHSIDNALDFYAKYETGEILGTGGCKYTYKYLG